MKSIIIGATSAIVASTLIGAIVAIAAIILAILCYSLKAICTLVKYLFIEAYIYLFPDEEELTRRVISCQKKLKI